MKKLIALVILLTAALVASACSTPASPTAIGKTTGVIGTASPAAAPTPQATSALDPSVEGLLALIAENDPQTDIQWVRENYRFPAVVTEYGKYVDLNAKYVKPGIKSLLAYVQPVDGSHVDLDDVQWVDAKNESGFEIINDSVGYKRVALSKDAMAFLNFDGTDITYSIPIDTLADQIAFKKNNLFTVYLDGDTVKLLFERYQP